MLCTICNHSDPKADFGAQCPNDQSYLVDEVSHREGQGDSLLGRLIGDEFAIVGIIGTGGFGSVYRCIQQPIGRTVAVKILHGHAYRRVEVRRRFVREAKALARLSDPHIVQFIRFSEVKSESGRLGQDFFFIAQEYVDGFHLGEIIRSSSPMPWTRVRFLTRSILKALAAAHKQSITHRDLKPSNIMVCEDAFQGDLVKVLDFGIAKFLAEQDEDEDHTVTGTLLGTPNYMSPEQIRNQPVGPASDLYAVGILMYEMLPGKRPIHRESKIDTLRAHLEGAVPDLSGLPIAAQKIIAVALCKSPEDRFETARGMAEALDRMDSLGSFTSDGATSPYVPIDINSIVDLSQEESTQVDSTSVVVDRMQRSVEESFNLAQTVDHPETSEPRPLGSVIILALVGCLMGGIIWYTQSSQMRATATNQAPVEQMPIKTRVPKPAPVSNDSAAQPADPVKIETTKAPAIVLPKPRKAPVKSSTQKSDSPTPKRPTAKAAKRARKPKPTRRIAKPAKKAEPKATAVRKKHSKPAVEKTRPISTPSPDTQVEIQEL